jgi:hypothetical protein
MEYFLFLISLAAIINSLVTKKAGIRNSYVSLYKYPKIFTLVILIYCFCFIFSFLGIIKVIDM